MTIIDISKGTIAILLLSTALVALFISLYFCLLALVTVLLSLKLKFFLIDRVT